jgi:cleavage and polyadenylation specificity factor subunit 3
MTSSSSSSSKRSLDHDVMRITPLGAGQEVGRSCVLMQFKGKNVLFDAGVHPAYTGMASLPYFDMIDDPEKIDVLLVTHFHLDHCASVPYFTEKTSFKGRIFMTHPTKAVFKLILSDFVKVSNIATEEQLYTEQDLLNCLEKIETINYHQELDVNGIKFWCYNAGHVLGAAMFMVEIDGTRVLYTGDYSRQTDRHLMMAELPNVSPDVLIVESTYGKQVHEPRETRERRFTSSVHNIVGKRRGRCLMPVFALGRAQELLLILDEYWQAHPELHGVPIYYASQLAQRAQAIYQTYIYMMNQHIRDRIAVSNPFEFKHVSYLKSLTDFDDSGPSVVMASPGMLQSGMSRELFERWCPDKRNGLVIPGYVVEGTLAKHVLTEPDHITLMSGLTAPRRITVEYISFSAHADFQQTSDFIDALEPPHIVLVHGHATEMSRLKGALLQKYRGQKIAVYDPRNSQTVELSFQSEKIAKLFGSLAAAPPVDGDKISGIMVQHHFSCRIVAAGELRAHTTLQTSLVEQRLSVPFYQPFVAARRALRRVFAPVDETVRAAERAADDDDDDAGVEADGDDGDDAEAARARRAAKPSGGAVPMLPALRIHDDVFVVRLSDSELRIEWNANPVADMVVDAAVAALVQLDVANAAGAGDADADAAAAAATDDVAQAAAALAEAATRVLSHVYTDVVHDAAQKRITLRAGATAATIDLFDSNVVCEPANETLLHTLRDSWRRIKSSLANNL